MINVNFPKMMAEQEFTRAYRAAHEAAGDSWSTLDVVRSWHAYQRDPAGHFLTKNPPELVPV